MDFFFDEAVTVEAAVYLLKKIAHHRTSIMKLLKLLYLADRRALILWGSPITGARPWGMEHGPVLSEVYDLIKGSSKGYASTGQWNKYIKRIDKETVEMIGDTGEYELSRAQQEVLDEIYAKYGRWTASQLSKYTHELLEYHLPTGGRKLRALNYEDVLRDSGKDEETIRAIAEDAKLHTAMKKRFGV